VFVGNDVFQEDIKRYNWDTFTPVAVLGESPMALIAAPNSPVNTPAEFLQLLKKPTRFVNIATGSGATSFIFEYFMYLNSGRNMIENIPYKNTPEIALAVASGQTEFGLLPIAGAGKLAEAGKVKIIGITGDRTLPAFPAVPVINIIKIQSGWYFTLPPNTPRDIVDWYQREFNRAIRSDEYRQWAESMYITVDENKLDPVGVKKYAEFLRKTFMPVASQIKKP
jgi:tripartite-type tricarboxylate transporter receptor subunit TctC